MKRKYSILAVVFAILIMIAGCSAPTTPEETTSELIEAMIQFDFDSITSTIDPSNSISQEELNELVFDEGDLIENNFLDYLKNNASNISYEIKSIQTDDKKAVVSVQFTYVDGSEFVQATLAEYLDQVFTLALAGTDITDEMNVEILVTAIQNQRELIEESTIQKTIDIKCVQVDDRWYVEELSNELLDVLMSNFISAVGENEDPADTSSESNTDETKTIAKEVASPTESEPVAVETTTPKRTKHEGRITSSNKDIIVIEKYIGDVIPLSTMNLVIKDFNETKVLTSEYGAPVYSTEDAKFIVIEASATNTTKQECTLVPTINIIDDQSQEFTTYDNSITAIDDALDYVTLSPSIKKTGHFVYEVPFAARDYVLLVYNNDSNEMYFIVLE